MASVTADNCGTNQAFSREGREGSVGVPGFPNSLADDIALSRNTPADLLNSSHPRVCLDLGRDRSIITRAAVRAITSGSEAISAKGMKRSVISRRPIVAALRFKLSALRHAVWTHPVTSSSLRHRFGIKTYQSEN